MHRLISLFMALFLSLSVEAFQTGNYHFKSIWDGRAEFQGSKLVVVGINGHGFTGDKLVLIKDGTKINYFSLFSSPNFYGETNSKFEGHNEYFKATGRVLRKNQLLTLTLIPSYGTQNHSGVFERSKDGFESLDLKNEIMRELDERLADVSEEESVSSIKDFKKVLLRFKDTMGMVVPDDHSLLYTVPFQQEQDWQMTLPNSKLRNVSSNNDYLVTQLRDADQWSGPQDRSAEVVSYLRFDSAFTLGNSVLAQTARKYIQHEIVNRWYFKCGGKTYWTEDTTWVLTDGSYFKYAPTSDCQ